MSNKVDQDYQNLLQDILDNGNTKLTRNGGTISVFGRTIRHKMSSGFPLLTTKKLPFKLIVTELLWFLKGSTNVEYLLENNCHIWDGDLYARYKSFCSKLEEPDMDILVEDVSQNRVREMNQEEFVERLKTDEEFRNKFGELGFIYGYQWRNWNGEVDQIKNLIHDLKYNPDSRRLIVTAWNPSDLQNQVLPPCHIGYQCYTRELSLGERIDHLVVLGENRLDILTELQGVEDANLYLSKEYNVPMRALSLAFQMRSNDFGLGFPFNLASYSLLLMILAKFTNMIPEEVIANLGDVHVYLNQVEGITPQLEREPYELPEVVLPDGANLYEDLDTFLSKVSISDFILKNYKSHPSIKLPLSN